MVEKLLTFGARQRLVSFLIIMALSAAAVVGIVDLKVDTSYDSLFSKVDPSYPAYLGVVEEFGSDNTTIIHLKSDTLFTSDKLLLLEDLHYALEEIKGVEKVESL